MESHEVAIDLVLALRQYCEEHGLVLHDVLTQAWFDWNTLKLGETYEH